MKLKDVYPWKKSYGQPRQHIKKQRHTLPTKFHLVKWSEVDQSCPTLCQPMDCSLPGSSVYGIFRIRIVEWVAIFFSRVFFPTQGSNPGLPHCRQMLLPSEPPGKSHPEVCLVKAVVFPAVMYGCESWAVQKAGRWRIDAFELQCWRRLLRIP